MTHKKMSQTRDCSHRFDFKFLCVCVCCASIIILLKSSFTFYFYLSLLIICCFVALRKGLALKKFTHVLYCLIELLFFLIFPVLILFENASSHPCFRSFDVLKLIHLSFSKYVV